MVSSERPACSRSKAEYWIFNCMTLTHGIEGCQRLGIFLGRVDVVESTSVQGLEQMRHVTKEEFSGALATAGLEGRERRGGCGLPNGAQGFRQAIVGAAKGRGQAGRVAFTHELREHGVRQKRQVASHHQPSNMGVCGESRT